MIVLSFLNISFLVFSFLTRFFYLDKYEYKTKMKAVMSSYDIYRCPHAGEPKIVCLYIAYGLCYFLIL